MLDDNDHYNLDRCVESILHAFRDDKITLEKAVSAVAHIVTGVDKQNPGIKKFIKTRWPLER